MALINYSYARFDSFTREKWINRALYVPPRRWKNERRNRDGKNVVDRKITYLILNINNELTSKNENRSPYSFCPIVSKIVLFLYRYIYSTAVTILNVVVQH